MNEHPAWAPELHDLFDRLQDDSFSERDRLRLNELLAAGPEQRRCFITYMDVHSWLAWEGVEKKAPDELRPWESRSAEADAGVAEEQQATHLVQGSSSATQSPVVAAPAFLSSLAFGRMGDFSSGWPVAYLIATLIFAVGLFIGAMTHVSQPVDVVHKAPSPAREVAAPDLKSPSVGRITGMVGCKGTDALARAVCGDAVRLGGKYALSVGLLEITYDTGARVILQGPVTYEVESDAGGFLSIGKLTAKLEKRSASANQKYFVVRTPTALVTDLGTEFGVEVSPQDGTRVCVLQGRVALQPASAAGSQGVVLEMGQSSRVDAAGKLVGASEAETASQKKRFVRQMPSQSVNRIAYKWQIGGPGTFAVAQDDLINTGRPTLFGIELTFGTAEWHSGIGKLIDGRVYGPGALRERPEQDTEDTFNPSDGAMVTVALNTTAHPQGYDVQSIVVLTGSSGRRGQERGWTPQDRSSQRFDLAYSLVGVPERFVTLQGDKKATVDRDAQGYPEMQVTITSGGNRPIASGVAKLRFTFHNSESSDPESMYREIDVLGAATGETGGAENENTVQPSR